MSENTEPENISEDTESLSSRLYKASKSLTNTFNSPLLLPIVILLYCAVQPSFLGIWYMISLVIFSAIRIGIFSFFQLSGDKCRFDAGISTLNPSVFISMFTILFIITPMIVYSQYKIYVIIILLCYTSTTYFLIKNCFETYQLFADIMLGIIFGVVSFITINASYLSLNKDPEFLFIVSAGSAQKCAIASSQNFKCQVYQNGQLLTTKINKPGYSL
jgi:hypothetical protein